MCGLTAAFSAVPVSLGVVRDMTRLIAHRGPDDEGFAVFPSPGARGREPVTGADAAGHVVLGHRRLSIVETTKAGHQPMASVDGNCWVVFNGEIYNHRTLRQELAALGLHGCTDTDTEVLLLAWQAWGEAMLARLEGMFSFIVVDTVRGTCLISRDRFGIKPLYYAFLENALYLASEIKQFTAVPGWQARLNRRAAFDFLHWSALDHTDQTLFDGVMQLLPGHCVRLDLSDIGKVVESGQLPTKRWYKLEPAPLDRPVDADQFHSAFSQAVKSHSVCAVPLGSCLSGGLDSSSIVASLRELQDRGELGHPDIHTFSAVSEDARVDESVYIDAVVAACGTRSHRVQPDPLRLAKDVRELIWFQDEPFGSTSIHAQSEVFRLAAEAGIKVMLDGQGADEQLGGYSSFIGPHLLELLLQGRWRALAREWSAYRSESGRSHAQLAMRVLDTALPQALRLRLRSLVGKSGHHTPWIAPEAQPAIDQSRDTRTLGLGVPPVLAHSLDQLTHDNLQMLLHWEDRSSMRHSLESRVPFLDHGLVELSLAVATDDKLHEAQTKFVLRRAMRGRVPDPVLDRRDKIGFATAEARWFMGPLRALVDEGLALAVKHSRGFVTQRVIDDFARASVLNAESAQRFWRYACFGFWLERFEVRC